MEIWHLTFFLCRGKKRNFRISSTQATFKLKYNFVNYSIKNHLFIMHWSSPDSDAKNVLSFSHTLSDLIWKCGYCTNFLSWVSKRVAPWVRAKQGIFWQELLNSHEDLVLPSTHCPMGITMWDHLNGSCRPTKENYLRSPLHHDLHWHLLS